MAGKRHPETVITFFTTHAAMRAEKLLRQMGIAARLIPTPRHIAADCTLALRIPAASDKPVRAVFTKHGIEVSGFHQDDTAPAGA